MVQKINKKYLKMFCELVGQKLGFWRKFQEFFPHVKWLGFLQLTWPACAEPKRSDSVLLNHISTQDRIVIKTIHSNL